MDLAEYTRIYHAVYGKPEHEADALLAKFGRTRAWFEATRSAVDARARTEPKVAAECNARVLRINASVEKSALSPPTLLRYVRARQCFRCGGSKRIAPRTAYIYCDYCSVLFDYDEEIAQTSKSGDAARAIFGALIDGVRSELERAKETGDDAAYLRAWHWPYEMDIVLCPENWSPRVGDPAYRKAVIDFCAHTCLIQNRDPRRREASIRRGEARDFATKTPCERTFIHYLACLWDVLVVEEKAYQAAGLFDRHPDGLDASTYHRINMVLNVVEWRHTLSENDFDLLLRLSKIPMDRAEVDPVSTRQAACGHCGGQLLLVEGARSVVCESCGHTLDCSRPYPCSSCGAYLLAFPGVQNPKCGWCGTLMDLIG